MDITTLLLAELVEVADALIPTPDSASNAALAHADEVICKVRAFLEQDGAQVP